MEIQNPQTATFVALHGASNFQCNPSGIKDIPEAYTFNMDWSKGGEGQEILRDFIRSKSPLCVRVYGKPYIGAVEFEHGINSTNGGVMLRKADR